MNFDEAIRISGWLKKKQPKTHFASYQNRFFVISQNGDSFSYYKNAYKSGDKPQKSIEIKLINSLESRSDLDFNIYYQERIYELRADSEGKKNSWIESLRFLLSYNRNKNSNNPNHQKRKTLLPFSNENGSKSIEENKILEENEKIPSNNRKETNIEIKESEFSKQLEEKERISQKNELNRESNSSCSEEKKENFELTNEKLIAGFDNNKKSKDDKVLFFSKEEAELKEIKLIKNEEMNNNRSMSFPPQENFDFLNKNSNKSNVSTNKENFQMKKEDSINLKEIDKSFAATTVKIPTNDIIINESIKRIFDEKAIFKFLAYKNNSQKFNNKRLVTLKKEYLIWYLEREDEIPQNVLKLEDVISIEFFDDGFQINIEWLQKGIIYQFICPDTETLSTFSFLLQHNNCSIIKKIGPIEKYKEAMSVMKPIEISNNNNTNEFSRNLEESKKEGIQKKN